MNEPRIKVDGIPLEDVLVVEQSIEIAQHLKCEAKTLAAQCGVRRRTSGTRIRLSRPGRPTKAVSLLLLRELEYFLKDETLLLRENADLFGLTLNELGFYQRRLSVHRKRGRKCRRS